MTSAAPSTVPAAELALLRTARRLPSERGLYPPPVLWRRDYAAELRALPPAGSAEIPDTHAIYLHLPFCYTACVFCHCNKIVTRDGGKATRYLAVLEREIALRTAESRTPRRVSRMRWGGGTPTYHSVTQLQRLWQTLARHFEFEAGGDYAIEIDPRTVDAAAIRALRDIGFTDAIIAIPDLDAEVLAAVHRPQSVAQSLGAIAAARAAGFATVSADLMAGLPRQTAASFIVTVGALAASGADRIRMHDYLHEPRRWSIQRQISYDDLPRAAERLEMAGLAAERLEAAGYLPFAPGAYGRADDPWVRAREHGVLAHDLLGHTGRAPGTVIPIGVGAIGAAGWVYTQNEPELGAYYDRVAADVVPVARGLVLKPDDLLRREVMDRIGCHGRVPFAVIEDAYSIVFERYFATELQALRPYEAAGLVRVGARELVLGPRGLLWAGTVCALFDRYRGRR